MNNGTLSGGLVQCGLDPSCVGDVIDFGASGVVDSGGSKRVNCVVQPIAPVTPTYTWKVFKPDGGLHSQGAGQLGFFFAAEPGVYTISYTATANRDCPPPPLQLPSVTVMVVRIRPMEVTFSGPQYHVVWRDDGSGPYPEPHWKDISVPPDDDNDDIGDHNIPVAFTRNSQMRVSAKFSVEPPGALGVMPTVAGVGMVGDAEQFYNFDAVGSASGGVLTITDVPADRPLVNTVDYFRPLKPLVIRWWITAEDGTQVPCSPPETTHRVYVTLGDPNPGPLYETVVHLGCNNAAGFSNTTDVIDTIFNDFTDREVYRKTRDGFNNPDLHQLTYYEDWNCVNLTTLDLIQNGDGQCGSWARLFIDILGAQGINHANEYITFYSRDSTDPSLGFIVKNWSFAPGGGVSGDPEYPYLNLYNPQIITEPPYEYNWRFSETNDETGVPGQGTGNPASLFSNHQVVKFGSPPVYYDPSYGAMYSSLSDIDSFAVEGYWQNGLLPVKESLVQLDLDGDGNITDMDVLTPVFIFQLNPAGNQLVENAIEYP